MFPVEPDVILELVKSTVLPEVMLTTPPLAALVPDVTGALVKATAPGALIVTEPPWVVPFVLMLEPVNVRVPAVVTTTDTFPPFTPVLLILEAFWNRIVPGVLMLTIPPLPVPAALELIAEASKVTVLPAPVATTSTLPPLPVPAVTLEEIGLVVKAILPTVPMFTVPALPVAVVE